MLLRNYDNIEALIKMPLAQTSGGGTSVRDPYVKGENFGDGYLSFKDSQAIWDLSEKSLQPYLVELEKIRDRVFAGNYDIRKETSKIVPSLWW